MRVAYLKEDGESVVFTGSYMECYIPMYYFDKGVATLEGEFVNTMGIFNFRVTTNANQDIAKGKVHTFKAPSMIIMKPSSMEKREIELISGKPEVYRVLKFYNGDKVLTSTNLVAHYDNVELFILKLLSEGKIPDTIPYETVFKMLLENLELNAMNLGTPGVVYALVVAEICRYNKDLALPFRKIIGKGGSISQTDYTPVNLRTLCSYSSTFSALTFEDIDTMVITSVNKKRYNKKETQTPVEEIIRIK